MQALIWVIVGIVLLAGVVALIIVGMRTASSTDGDQDPLMARLAEYSERGELVSLEQLELDQPFSERVLVPLLRAVGEFSSRFTPQKVVEQTRLNMELAGNPIHVEPTVFLASRFVVALLFGGFLILIFAISPTTWSIGRMVLVVLIFTVLGFAFPQLWLKGRINSRQKEIRKAMPDALDLLTICVEAGLGFDAAMSKVSEKWENQLSLAFGRAIRFEKSSWVRLAGMLYGTWQTVLASQK